MGARALGRFFPNACICLPEHAPLVVVRESGTAVRGSRGGELQKHVSYALDGDWLPSSAQLMYLYTISWRLAVLGGILPSGCVVASSLKLFPSLRHFRGKKEPCLRKTKEISERPGQLLKEIPHRLKK